MMMKKLFALASITALTGLVSAVGVAGCSETVTDTTPTPDAGPDPVKPKVDASTQPDDDDDDDETVTCATKDSIDATKFPYKKAEQVSGACTADELKKLTDWFAGKANASEEIKASAWKAEVSDACGECIFSAEEDDAWGPIIVKDDKLDFVNEGGCVEIASGKESCGRAWEQVNKCLLEACLLECKTQEEFDVCRREGGDAILAGPCKDSLTVLQTECGSNVTSYISACEGKAWTFEGPMAKQCGGTGTAPDGGTPDGDN